MVFSGTPANPRGTMKTILLASLLFFLELTPGAKAQGVGASGEIRGTVFDPTGGVIPNASVEAVDTAKGTHYTATAEGTGQYEFPNLPPSTYEVTVRHAGMQTQVQKGLELEVGQTATLDFRLALEGTSVQVEVSAEQAVVETTRGSQAETLSQTYIDNLPINRRDYLTFTLLVPGVSNSNTIADNADFRVKQTPQSGLSFYGSNGRGNSVTVDGGEFNDDAGGVRLNLSQDAVQEFQVNRSNYTAELGGASGATINIVSKSGTNEVHGTLYSYFRNDGLDAADPFARTQALAPGAIFDPTQPDTNSVNTKNALTRYQFGGTAGFPITKDKSFLFVSFEGLLQDAQNSVPILTSTSLLRPTAAQDAIIAGLTAQGGTIVTCFAGKPQIPAAFCAGALASGLTVSQSTGLSQIQNGLKRFLL